MTKSLTATAGMLFFLTAFIGCSNSGTTTPDTTAATPGSPLSPAGITGAKTGTGAGTVTIAWEAPAETGIGNDGNPATITKYKLYRSETPGFALADTGVIATEITDATLREYEVSGLAAASKEYYFKLTAFNSIGEGSPTAEFSAFTPTGGLGFTPINTDTEYSVDKGTVSIFVTAIAIPTYYEGKEVTAIDTAAFDDFRQLASIQLPDGLKTIGGYAFYNCPNLALTSLPDGVIDIGKHAFQSCTKLALTSLPDGITSIEDYAFSGCSSLALTSLPDGITSIGGDAFEGCTSLALTSLPDGITSIGLSAFNGCSSLALTSLPDGITTIYIAAFADCSSLALTSLPDGITRIWTSAFAGCTKLALTSLPDSVTSIEEYAFKGCTGLTEITINRSTPPTANTEIFKDCTNLTKIKVPSANVDDYKTASGWDTYSNLIESI